MELLSMKSFRLFLINLVCLSIGAVELEVRGGLSDKWLGQPWSGFNITISVKDPTGRVWTKPSNGELFIPRIYRGTYEIWSSYATSVSLDSNYVWIDLVGQNSTVFRPTDSKTGSPTTGYWTAATDITYATSSTPLKSGQHYVVRVSDPDALDPTLEKLPADPIDIPGFDGCPALDELTTPGNSIIDNVRQTHIHQVVDYQAPNGVSLNGACSSCGVGAKQDESGAKMPMFQWERIHRYRDLEYHGSFGPGVYSNFDAQVIVGTVNIPTVYPDGTAGPTVASPEFQVWSPLRFALVRLRPVYSTVKPELIGGVLRGGRIDMIGWQTLGDTLVDSVAITNRQSLPFRSIGLVQGEFDSYPSWDQTTLNRVTFIWHDGGSETFEAIAPHGTSVPTHGRLVRWQNAAGHGFDITYADAATATVASLGNDPARLWRMAAIRDGYGLQGVPAYVYANGQWVVSALTTPNGSAIQYAYGQDQLIGLNAVTLGDGSSGTFKTRYDQAQMQQEVMFDDPAGVGLHRRKSIFLTTAYAETASNQLECVVPNLIRKVRNGNGETSYRLWVEKTPVQVAANVASPAQIWVYRGGMGAGETSTGSDGSHVVRIALLANGRPALTEIATNYRLGDPPETPSFKTVSAVQYDQTSGAVARRVAGTAAVSDYQRDSKGRVTAIQSRRADVVGAPTVLRMFSFTEQGRPDTEQDPMGRQTKRIWSSQNSGLLLSLTVGYGSLQASTWNWTYTARGLVETSTDANGKVANYGYNADGFLTTVSDPPDATGGARAARTYSYDAAGRLVGTSYGGSMQTSFDYDARNRLVCTTFADGTTEKIAYGLSGQDVNMPIERIDRVGNRTVFTYDGNGRLVAANTYGPSAAKAVSTTQQWYVSGTDLVAMRTVDGRTERYAYDANRRRVSTTVEMGASYAAPILQSRTVYDDEGRAIEQVDPYGRRILALYGSTGLMERQITELIPGGIPAGADLSALPRITTANPPYRITDMAYDLSGAIVSITNANGVIERRFYDGQGRPSQVVRADMKGTSVLAEATREDFEYDAQGNLLTIWRPRSFVRSGAGFTLAPTAVKTVMTYTGRNKLASVTEASGTADAATVKYTYTLAGQLATRSDPRNAAWLTTYRYTSCCDRVKEIEDPQGYITRFDYDGNGRVLSYLDPDGVGLSRTYDPVGRLLTETTTGQQTTRFTYDPTGSTQIAQELLRSADPGLSRSGHASMTTVYLPDGTVTRSVRDALGRELVTQGADGGIAKVGYDQIADGLVQVVRTDPVGATTTAAFDGGGHSRRMINAVNGTTLMSYDAQGNLVSGRDPNAVGSDLLYDGLNRMTQITDTVNATRRFVYDAHGNIVRIYDPTNAYDEVTYNLRDLPTQQKNRRSLFVKLGYDKRGNRTSLIDEQGKSTSWSFDSRNLLTQVSYPNPAGGSVSMTYDPAGRLKTRTDQAGIVTTLVYDAGGRLTNRQFSDGPEDTFGYDSQGRLVSAQSGRYGIANSWTFGPDGRMATETQALDGETWTMRYAYDLNGRLRDRVLPDGMAEMRAYSVLGHPQLITLDNQVMADRGYDLAGRRTTTKRGNGLTETWSYKANDDLVAAIVENGVSNLGYAYNSRKLPTSVTDARTATGSQTFTVDAQDRLTGWTRGSPAAETWSWTLSDAGDWNALTKNGVATARAHNEVHATTAVGATVLTYDPRGNLTTDKEGRAFVWDNQNRLASATVAGKAIAMRYDALGRRVALEQGGMRTVYAQTGSQTVWSERVDPSARAAWKPPTAPTPDGQPALPVGAILDFAGTERFNWQPEGSAVPAGWRKDFGLGTALRDGLTSGWRGSEQRTGVDRDWLGWPIYDTYIRLAPTGGARGTWEVMLPNGTYAVVIVCGDARSHGQTNHLVVNGQAVRDPSPYNAATNYGYPNGDFDGYAINVTVTNGRLEIRSASDAVDPKLCFIEIGPAGSSVTQAITDRLAQSIARATAATEDGRPSEVLPERVARIHGEYIDDCLAERRRHGSEVSSYYLHTDRRYSVLATTDGSGQVVERYRYTPYGDRTVLAGDGVTVRPNSFISAEGSFTGYPQHDDLGLMYARNRWYSPSMGRFVSRDPTGYVDGTNLYSGYFAPNGLDPHGLWEWDGDWVETVVTLPWALSTSGDARSAFGNGASQGATMAVNGMTFGQIGIVNQAAQMNVQGARENGDSVSLVGFGLANAGGSGVTAGMIGVGGAYVATTRIGAAVLADPVVALAAENIGVAGQALALTGGAAMAGWGAYQIADGDYYNGTSNAFSGGMLVAGGLSGLRQPGGRGMKGDCPDGMPLNVNRYPNGSGSDHIIVSIPPGQAGSGGATGIFNPRTGDLYVFNIGVTPTGQGLGTQVFNQMLRTAGPDVMSISGNLASDNARAFQAAINAGYSVQDALAMTPAGRMRINAGYGNLTYNGGVIRGTR